MTAFSTRLFCITAFVFNVPGAARASDPPNALHLVAVGITNAQGTSPLRATAKDALDKEAWARSQEGKLYRSVNAKSLTNERATRNEILSAIGSLKCKAKQNDYVILYMSAHGGKNRNGEYEFVAYDGPITWTAIKEALNRLPGTKIVILDTCNAGAIKHSGNLIVFSACLADELSKDGPNAQGNSLFTRYLLEGLSGKADMNNNGAVSLSEAAAYVSGRLEIDSAHLPRDRRQTSTVWHPENIPGDLPLSRTVANVAVAPVLVPAPVNAAAGLSGTEWSGRETGAGSLRFQFKQDGQAVMFDEVNREPVQGTWSQQGNAVTITFGSYVYSGQIVGDTLAGNARGSNRASWEFRVTRMAPAAAPAPVAQANVVALAGTMWKGREDLGALSFEFKADGTVIMIDEVTPRPVRGNWTQQGVRVRINFNNCMYEGTITGMTLSGQATMDHERWNFTVSKN